MHSRLFLGFALVLYIATRCYMFLQTEVVAPTTGDAGHYYIIAQNLAAHNSYSDSPINTEVYINPSVADSPRTAQGHAVEASEAGYSTGTATATGTGTATATATATQLTLK